VENNCLAALETAFKPEDSLRQQLGICAKAQILPKISAVLPRPDEYAPISLSAYQISHIPSYIPVSETPVSLYEKMQTFLEETAAGI
jgi:hypothetical protein